MKMLHRLTIYSLSSILTFSLFFCGNSRADKQLNSEIKHESKNEGKKTKKNKEAPSTDVRIIQKYELPPILKEISGMAYISKDRFACVQDEAGAIFIYNVATSKLENQIAFGAAGDYEGITLVGKTAYIIRSDGKLFQVNSIETKTPDITEYDTGLTSANDVEGLTFDAKNNRLLLAIKGHEMSSPEFKGIYAFDLSSKKLVKNPVYKINLTDPVFSNSSAKKLNSVMQPSEIAINPVSGNIYITEAANPQILILDASGAILKRYKISNNEFNQPEGITFSPTGQLFISNEGAKESGNILEVKIDNL